MKILQLGKFYPPNLGGIETVMYDITEELNQRGFTSDVLCSNDCNTYQEDIINGYKVMRTPTLGIYFSTSITPVMIKKLREIINQYDVIHVHLPDPMANLALFLTKLKGKKVVVHWHSDIIKQKYLLKLYEPLQAWLLRRADAIIATTPKYMEGSKYLQRHKDKCVAIPIGIDPNRLTSNEMHVAEIQHRFSQKKIVFALGRLAYYKGFNVLIDAAKELNEEFIILIGGGGELKVDLQKQIDENQLGEKVKLLGRLEDDVLGDYYAASTLFCLPSIMKSEAFGVVQIEAMSFAKPIVTTKIPFSGVDWVNEDGVSGINVEVGSATQLAEAIKRITMDVDRYNAFCSDAKKRFETYFIRPVMVKTIIALYENLTLKS